MPPLSNPESLSGSRGPLAPVVLFAYNRPELLRQTAHALSVNDLAPQSDLIVFCEAAKNPSEAGAVAQVRAQARAIAGFRSLSLVERDQHMGLAHSVIAGVSQVCRDFGRAIVVEDDLLVTRDFLAFMNQALQKYRCQPKIFSLSGFNFGLDLSPDYPVDAFCFYRSSSWGWATWQDRWEKADWEIAGYPAFSHDRERRRAFDRGGEDLSYMLDLQMQGKMDSWAIRWAYTHYALGGLALLSARPRVLHVGVGGKATHVKRDSARQLPLTLPGSVDFRFPDAPAVDPALAARLQESFRPSPARRLVRFFKRSGIAGKSSASRATQRAARPVPASHLRGDA